MQRELQPVWHFQPTRTQKSNDQSGLISLVCSHYLNFLVLLELQKEVHTWTRDACIQI